VPDRSSLQEDHLSPRIVYFRKEKVLGRALLILDVNAESGHPSQCHMLSALHQGPEKRIQCLAVLWMYIGHQQ
jgi:hypothetical protein